MVLAASGADILFVCLDVSVLSVFNNNVRLVVQDKSFGKSELHHLRRSTFIRFPFRKVGAMECEGFARDYELSEAFKRIEISFYVALDLDLFFFFSLKREKQ